MVGRFKRLIRTRRGEVGELAELADLPDPADEVESDLSLRNPVLMLLMVEELLVFPESAMAAAAVAAFSSGEGRSSVRMIV